MFGPLAATFLYQRNETFNSDTNSVLYGSTPRISAILAPQQLFGAPIYASLNSEYVHLPYPSALTDGVRYARQHAIPGRCGAVTARAAVAVDMPVGEHAAPRIAWT
mgnify:CR=1 FL=1